MSAPSQSTMASAAAPPASQKPRMPKITHLFLEEHKTVAETLANTIELTGVADDLRVDNSLTKVEFPLVQAFNLLFDPETGPFSRYHPDSIPTGDRKVSTFKTHVKTFLKCAHEHKQKRGDNASPLINQCSGLHLKMMATINTTKDRLDTNQQRQAALDGHEQRLGMQPRGRDGGNTNLNRTVAGVPVAGGPPLPPVRPPTAAAARPPATTRSNNRSNITAAATTAASVGRRGRRTAPVRSFIDPIVARSDNAIQIDRLMNVVMGVQERDSMQVGVRAEISQLMASARNAREFGFTEQAKNFARMAMNLQLQLSHSTAASAVTPPPTGTTTGTGTGTASPAHPPPSPSSSSSDEDDEEREERELRMSEEGGMAQWDFFGGPGFG